MKRKGKERYSGYSLWFHLSMMGGSNKVEARDVHIFGIDYLWLNYSNYLARVSSSLLQAPCICVNWNALPSPLVFPNVY